jgi:hypothetical protein
MNFAKGEWLRLGLWVSYTGIAGMFLSGELLAQAVDRPDLSIELIDLKVLRVCADPNNTPFSTDKGEGFEGPTPLVIDTRVDSSAAAIMHDLATGEIDAGILWGGRPPDEPGGDRRAAGQRDESAAGTSTTADVE